jgi:bacterioferritin
MSVKKENTLLEDLNQALAGETLAAFRYLYLSKIAIGINSPPLATMFQEIAREEWVHASAFMGRIVQLGGVPVARPAELEKRSFLPYYEPPRRGNDLKALIKDGLKLERASIDFFQKLAVKTRDSDMITYKIAMDVMAQEAGDEQKLAALLD